MTCLVLTGCVCVDAYTIRLTFTEEALGAATITTQFDIRGTTPGASSFALIVDPETSDLHEPVDENDPGSYAEQDAASSTFFEFARAALGGQIPSSTDNAYLAVAEATARERLRTAIGRGLAANARGAA